MGPGFCRSAPKIREFGITNAKAIVAEIPKELERKARSRAILTMKFASCDDDP
ncbi:hypothetical protein [Leptospira noguchii]|uniref:Uncharacterized protein n=1 Tax=Leptospira noguchii TaxID=28182 RepID=A0AAE9GEP9_9LEPT|nr:hypothetical protein [Leptospira noguchii]UOG57560.1 hypothetical protein MAL03_05330 [Leptospira noguchii]